jgi:aminoglycoside phosphotransferase (APT) family kinase protein
VSDLALAAALRQRLDLKADPAALPAKGMAHAHFRLPGGRLARVPRWSQVGLDPAANLAHQATAFARAEPSGHTPRLYGTLPPGRDLPMGGLLVEEIAGRPPRLPDDMSAIARALAAIHTLPDRPETPPDPIGNTIAVIDRQAVYFARAGLDPSVLDQLTADLAWAKALPPLPPPPITLVGTDTHPGNFLIDAEGTAWFVDLEKATYGLPAIDLAHASLYTSTTWDPDVAAVLSAGETEDFYAAWAAAVPAELAEAVSPWINPARRLTWLRTLSWMARWKVEGIASHGTAIDPVVIAYVEARIADFFDPATMARVRLSL